MAAKIVVFVAALAACNAVPVPVWIDGNYVPGVVMRVGRSPNMAFGFGSGFSSNIGGLSHSTAMGASFQSGNAEAYGAGMGGSNGNFAQGVGMASAAPSHYPLAYQQAPFNGGLRNSFGSAVSSAQNYGNNYGSAASSAQTHHGLQYGAASSAAQNNGPHFQSAVSSAQNLRGLSYESAASAAHNNGMEFGSAVSAAENAGGFGSSMSAAQTHNGHGNFGSAVSAAQNMGGYRASTAQAVQHRGGAVQHSGASSVNAPGVQAAQSHAVNSGFY